MALVTIQVKNDLVVPAPVEDILVSFYDLSAIYQTSGTTDEDGNVTVDLPDGTYDVGFFKTGVSILPQQPQRIIVDHLLSNTFLVVGHERAMPESIDPRLCKISGHIFGIDGKKTKSRLVFELMRELAIINDQVIDMCRRLEVESDDSGYFEFELLRGQGYYAYFLYLDSFLGISPPAKVEAQIPDMPSVELGKVLFPLPIAAHFSDTTKTLSIASGEDDTMTADVIWSDGSTRWASFAWAGLQVINDQPKVADICISAGKIAVIPLSSGVTTLTVKRIVSEKAYFNPLADFTSDSLVVTVVP